MRKIKFRLIANGVIAGYEKWEDGRWWYAKPGGVMGEFDKYQFPISHDSKDQCAELKDKNGKEIYEGDIVQQRLPNWIKGEGEFVNTEEVIFDEGEFCGRRPDGYISHINIKFYIKVGFEVIGNIYENPELLK